jgi:predicted RNase H-like HicB family nuclease
MKEYIVVFERSSTGWGAYAPDVPGCVAVGDTLAETENLMREALEMHFGSMLEDGDPIPEPKARVMTMRPRVLDRELAKLA